MFNAATHRAMTSRNISKTRVGYLRVDEPFIEFQEL